MTKILWIGLLLATWSALYYAHPFLISLNLIVVSLAVAAISGLLLSKWVMYTLALVFLGGMMVIFIYVTSITSEQKFIKSPMSIISPAPLILVGLTAVPSSALMNPGAFLETYPSALIWVLLYILFSLFVVVKISLKFHGAMNNF